MAITIYGELYSLKNGKRIVKHGQRFALIPKAKVLTERDALLNQLKDRKNEWLALSYGKQYPLQVVFKIYRKSKRRFDYINIIQQLCDCMVKAGWIEDDNANILIPVFDKYEVDKDNPRTDIELL